MSEFEKQIESQLKIYQMCLQDEVNHLCCLMKRLNINDESQLNATLEFAELFNKLRSNNVITGL